MGCKPTKVNNGNVTPKESPVLIVSCDSLEQDVEDVSPSNCLADHSHPLLRLILEAGGQTEVSDNADICTICMCEICNDNCERLECGHSFHKECIREWRTHSIAQHGYWQSECPVCRCVEHVDEEKLLGAGVLADLQDWEIEQKLRQLLPQTGSSHFHFTNTEIDPSIPTQHGRVNLMEGGDSIMNADAENMNEEVPPPRQVLVKRSVWGKIFYVKKPENALAGVGKGLFNVCFGAGIGVAVPFILPIIMPIKGIGHASLMVVASPLLSMAFVGAGLMFGCEQIVVGSAETSKQVIAHTRDCGQRMQGSASQSYRHVFPPQRFTLVDNMDSGNGIFI